MVRASGYLLTGVIAIILCSGMASIPGASAATLIDDVSNGFGPYVDKVVYNVITQDDQQVLALQNDDIDLIGGRIDPVYFDELVAAEDIEVATTLRNGYGYATINTAKYPFNITAFRRALAFALDKEAISEDVFSNLSVSQDSCVPQSNPFSIEGQLPYTYYESNVILGQQLLQDAGFEDGDLNGYLEAPNGEAFSVVVECAMSSSIAIEVGERIADTLIALGIDAVSVPTDFYEYLGRLNFHGDYDIAFLGTAFSNFDVDWLAHEYCSEHADEPYRNCPNFQNSSYDAWRDQLLHATEYEAVYEAAIEMQRVFVYECPIIVCYEDLYLSAYRTDKYEEFVNDAIDGVPGWWTNQKVNLLDAQGGPFGGTLRWSTPLDIDTFNILTTSSTYSMNVLQELYEPLIRRDPQGDLMNWLAESHIIETNADNPAIPINHTRITFNIVQNATWSDGVPLSAQDVAFTMNFIRDGPGVAPLGGELTELYAAYAPQDYVFIAEFSTESYWHLSKMVDIPILPKHQWAPIGADNWNLYNPTFDELITSGPFYVSDYVAGNFTELTRNPLYFMTPPDYDGDIVMGYPPSVSPTINPQLDDADSLEQEFEAIWDTWSEPAFSPEIDPLLEKWVETGELDQSIISVQGNPRVIAYLAPWVGYSEVDGIVEIDWKMDFRAFKMIQGSVESGDELTELLSVNGITAVFADKMKNPIVDEFDRSIGDLPQTPSDSFDMSEFRDLIGSLGPTSSDYTGNGVVVGHIDSGCDFGINDLQPAFNNGTYDATGFGLNLATSLGNTSNVADVQSWLDAGNVLTYENASGVFLNATGWDPLLNSQGIHRYLIGDGEDGLAYNQSVGFVWLYAYYWGIQVGDFMDQMWNDVKLPDTSEVNGEYHLGYVFQQRGTSGSAIPYAKLFAPALVYESSANNEWNLAIDWDGADAWNLFWTGAFYYATINLLNSTETQPITDRLDFDFTDDISEETYNMSNPIVAKDLDGDGLVDLSLGALSWCLDQFGLFGDEPMVNGFRSDGTGFCLYFDHGSHGTATAAHVASRGVETYYDANNDTYFTMSGIANESEILSVRAITSGSEIGAYVWACGFDYNEGTSEFYYTGNHMADVITNSWGWVVAPSAEMNYISLIWTILSVPSYLDAGYPGVLHIFSSGNEGSGFMTVGPPGCSAGVLTVGASTSYSYVDYLYGPGQDVEGIASFSSKGPSFLGYVKPDVVAPGLAAYAPTPLYAQYYEEYWNGSPYWNYGDYKNVTLFSGTSQSTPVVAGAAALLIEALNTRGVSWTPDKIKTIIQSTSDPLGYDPATQGFGRINVDAACDFAENDVGFIVESSGSFDNIMDLLDEYWTNNSDYAGDLLDIPMPSGTLPTGFGEGSLFFGVVHAGDSVSLRQNVYGDASGTMLTDLTGWTTSAYYWNESETFTFDGLTHVYNDTAVSGKGAYGWFDIRTAIGATNYDSVTASSNYATICVSFADEDISAYGAPWMFLHDWTDDSPADGMPNLWNPVTEQGDELRRLASANDPSNANMMSYATSLADLNASLNGDLTLVIHDPIFDTDWSAVGNQFTCTVIFWETVSTSIISDNGGLGISTFDWNLTVPTDDAGIYQGYLEITNGSSTVAVPWSYNLAGNLSGGAGEEHTIVSDFGLELTPYDSPVYGCIEEDPDDYDFRSYVISNPNVAARYLGIRIVWDDFDCDMMVDLLGPDGTELASSAASTWNSTAILASIPSPYIGNYYLLVRPISLVGRTQLPVNYTINVMWYEDIPSPVVYPRYNSNWDSTLYPFTDYDVIEGDHVTLNLTFSESFIPNFPELEIQTTILSLNSGSLAEQTDNLVIPDGSYDPFSGIVDLTQFAWEVIDGIAEGDTVNIEVDFTNGDCDIMIWWTDTDDSTWSFSNNLVGSSMCTGARPEYGQFVADRSGNISVGIFDYDLVPGTYTLNVDTIESIVVGSSERTVIYDTYEIGRNGTFDIEVVGVTAEGTEFFAIWEDVTINNFFSPNVTVISPNGGETWTGTHSITWTATSLNAEGSPMSDVYISNDAGYSYMLFAVGLTGTTLDWDTSIWQDMDSYMVMVKAQDRGLTGEDESDGIFTAGALPIQDVPPIIFGQLELNYSYGVTGNSLEWIISDLHPQLIALWVDDALVYSYSWNTIANVTTVNCDGLLHGNYNYTIYAGDEEGNSVTMTTWVNVVGDGLGPIISSPDDILYQLGTTGHEIVWELNDVDPSIYILYLDGTIEDSGAWNGSDITVNVDGLSVGTYNYTLYAEDLETNSAADTVWVEVIDDTTPPIIDAPANQTIVNGTTNNITWTVYDQYPTSYWIYQDGVLVDDGIWNSTEIAISIDALDIGVYDFTLVLTDIGGNFASDTVFVTVVDSSAPEFNLLPDVISFNEGETGFSITWNFTDDNPAQYVLYRNGSVVDSGTWTNPYSYEYAISVTVYGLHNFTIVVNDTTGFSVSHTAWVIINDVTPPSLNNPADISFQVGETGHVVGWILSDNNPLTYSITRNGTAIGSGQWGSGDSLDVSLDGLSEGTFLFTIVVFDQSGNFAMDTVIVEVLETPTDTTTTTTTTTEPVDIMTVIYIIITIGTIVVIVILVILFKRARK